MEAVKPLLEVAPPKIGQVYGNAEVVKMLERWLEAAKTGKIGYAAVIGIIPPNQGLWDYVGAVELSEGAPTVLEGLKSTIEQGLKNRALPVRDLDLDASYVVYNCCNQALSFDFLSWVVGAEMERVREDAPGPLKVGFWAGVSGTLGLDDRYRVQMFNNVVRPTLPLLGAVEDVSAVYGRSRGYRVKEIVDASRAGEPVPRFKPSKRAKATVESWFTEGEKIATITLREMDTWPHRNSNIEAWTKFADHLTASGYLVVFVRDTAKAEVPLPGHGTCPVASVSLDARCALYSKADANFLVSNGPASLLLFMDCPWLMLTQRNDESEYQPETSAWWERNGMKAGEQYPWCKPNQREVLSKDSLEEILEAWRTQEK